MVKVKVVVPTWHVYSPPAAAVMEVKSRLYWVCVPLGTLVPNINVGCWESEATHGTVTASPAITVRMFGGSRMIVSALPAVADGGGAHTEGTVDKTSVKLLTNQMQKLLTIITQHCPGAVDSYPITEGGHTGIVALVVIGDSIQHQDAGTGIYQSTLYSYP